MHTRQWIMLGLAVAVMWPTVAAAGPAEDKAKANQIATEIRDSGKLSNFRVGVKYENGVAILLGNVTDKSQAAAAMQVAEQVAGVTKVVNKLQLTEQQAAPATNALHMEAAKPLLSSVPSENGGMLLTMPGDESAEPIQQVSNKVLAKKLRKPSRQPKLQRVASRPKSTPSRQQAAPAHQAMTSNMPRPVAFSQQGQQPVQSTGYGYGGHGPRPTGYNPGGGNVTGVGYDNPSMPGYAWPSYAAPQNYSALTYPKQYSPTAWPYIGPFYPYPQVPLGWRKVALEWDDGWWFLDFSHHQSH